MLQIAFQLSILYNQRENVLSRSGFGCDIIKVSTCMDKAGFPDVIVNNMSWPSLFSIPAYELYFRVR